MSVDTAILRWRSREQRLWRSKVRLERPAPLGALDTDTGLHAQDDPTLIYEGKGQVRAFTWEGADTQTGEREVRMRGAKAKVPANTDAHKDDVLTVLASTYDAGLVGRTFRVTDVLRDDWQINRVLILEEKVD